MDLLLKSLAQHAPEFLLVLAIATFLLSAWAVRTSIVQRRFNERWKHLLQSSSHESLETLLYDHLRQRMVIENDINSLKGRTDELEDLMRSSKRHIGLIRFDAFEDVGGNQSFALAVYDDRGDGAVLSSIVGRTDCRVYCKPLQNGRSERDLSQEEQRAIREARNSGPRTIVSP